MDNLAPLAVGAALTLVAGLIAAWVQGRREHARWVRERRYEAYVAFLGLHNEALSAAIHSEVMPSRFSENEDHHVREIRASILKTSPSILAAIAVLGPDQVERRVHDLPVPAAGDLPGTAEANTVELVAAMRSELNISSRR